MNQNDLRRRLNLALALPLILMALLAAVFLALIEYQRSTAAWVAHTDQVLVQANRLETLLVDRENRLRAYLLNGDPAMLPAYLEAQAALDPAFRSLQQLVRDNPSQGRRLDALREVAVSWDTTASELVATERLDASDAAPALRRQGRQQMAIARAQLAEFISTEIDLREQRRRTTEQAVGLVVTTSVGLALLLGAILATFTRRQLLAAVRDYGAALNSVAAQSEALRASEARFRALFDHAPLGIAIVRDDALLMTNAYFATLFGAADGRSWLALVAPEARVPLRSWFEGRERGSAPELHETIGVRADGERFPFGLRTTVIALADGPATVVYVTDRSEQQRLEGQVRQMQKLESIGRLAGSIAHDFNNLLTAILGSAELARSAIPVQSPAQIDLAAIQQAGDNGTRLIRQLLTFARKQALAPQLLNLNDMVHAMEPLLRRLLGAGIDLNARVAPDLGLVLADQSQIEQVLLNLAVNARDAMPAGGKLTIETANVVLDDTYARSHLQVRPGAYAMLAVSDTGVGIPANIQSRLFEPFFTTKEPERGTGLGLATCYGIVTQHNGSIWVYSEVGRGSTFKVYLPLARAHPGAQPEQAADEQAPNWTVLIVEDDPAIREFAARILRTRGYTVLSASSGDEAVSLADQHPVPVDLLVTDLGLPKMCGTLLADQMRSVQPDLRVLFLTGYPNQALAHQQRLSPDVAVLHKPFAAAALLRAVRAALERGHGALNTERTV